MLTSLWTKALPAKERKLLELVTGLVSTLAPASIPDDGPSLIDQLSGVAPPDGALVPVGNLFRYLGNHQDKVSIFVDYLLNVGEANGIEQKTVGNLVRRLAPMLKVELNPELDLRSQISSAISQMGANMKNPLSPHLGALCKCPSCSFVFIV